MNDSGSFARFQNFVIKNRRWRALKRLCIEEVGGYMVSVAVRNRVKNWCHSFSHIERKSPFHATQHDYSKVKCTKRKNWDPAMVYADNIRSNINLMFWSVGRNIKSNAVIISGVLYSLEDVMFKSLKKCSDVKYFPVFVLTKSKLKWYFGVIRATVKAAAASHVCSSLASTMPYSI